MNNYNFYFFVLNISYSSYIANVKIQNFQSQYFVTNESWKKGKFYTDYTRLLVDRWFLVSWRYSLLKTGADNYTRSIHASREGPDETLMLCTPDMRCIESEFCLTSQVCNCHWCLQCHHSHNNQTYHVSWIIGLSHCTIFFTLAKWTHEWIGVGSPVLDRNSSIK